MHEQTDTAPEATYTEYAFRRFLALMPEGKDLELVVLRAHLMIEEQLVEIIRERLQNPNAMKWKDFTFFQRITLAKALCHADTDPRIWKGLKALGELRNEIAHNLDMPKLAKLMTALIEVWFDPSQPGTDDKRDLLITSFWFQFVKTADLVQTPDSLLKQLLGLLPPTEGWKAPG